ncbi:SapC family protein [Fretibacter rubidus]|uniref:SapC family protein n=1 Tax=Fretibacter rubidus TaxID=570162 RepID=UPI00352A5C9E
MPNHVAVNPRDHKDLRILEERSEGMGDATMCCITFPEEFRNLQNHYTILFQLDQEREAFNCLAMFGLENGENLFLDNGRWDASYVPLAMDIQPFMIGRPSDHDADRKVVIDSDSPRIGKGEGRRIFDDNGIPTAYLESISNKLSHLDGGYRASSEYIDCLKKYDLLEPLSIDVTMKDGAKNRLVGFHVIHEERLNKLSAEGLAELQSKGYLMPSYMALASLSNLSKLIARKEAAAINV